MKQTDPHFKMRLSPELKEQISVAAKAAGRSMNAEIVQRLDESFQKTERVVKIPSDVPLDQSQARLLGLWGDMTDTQRRLAIAVLEALVDTDSA